MSGTRVGEEEARSLGLYLKSRRVRYGLGQTAVAAAVGRSARWLADVEAGRRPLTYAEYLAIRNALDSIAKQKGVRVYEPSL